MVERRPYEEIAEVYNEVMGAFLDYVLAARIQPGTQEWELTRSRSIEMTDSICANHGWTSREFLDERLVRLEAQLLQDASGVEK